MNRQRGFSLIELVLVIVLLGIMAAGAGLLISRPIEAYADQARRMQLVDSADMALRKMTTDIRRALPNSLRLINNSPTGWAIEMMNTMDGGRYRDEVDGAGFNSADDILELIPTETNFNILGRLTNLSVGYKPSLRAVVYNTNAAELYQNASDNQIPGVISAPGLTLSLTGNEYHVELDNAFQFAFRSPTQRLFVVDGPISYICNSATGELTRLDGYAVQQHQISSVAGFPVNADRGLVATQVLSCDIAYQPGSTQRGGLITLGLVLTDSDNESVQLLRQVHVDNVP